MAFGISVYPDIESMDEIRSYFALASKYGATKVFSSMFSVEGTKEEVLAYFKELIDEAHKVNLRVSLDVNPECFKRMGATFDDLSVFKSINADILRMDLSFGLENDIKLLNNDCGIEIELNAGFINPKVYIDAGVEPSKLHLCHNFYPQKYTAMRMDKFRSTNKMIKSASRSVTVGAFISSNNQNTHGVWGAINGLPTVEMTRSLPIDLQARILLATKDVDDVLIGNAFASVEEFKALQEVFAVKDMHEEAKTNAFLKLFLDYGILDANKAVVTKFRVEEEQDNSVDEHDLLFKFYPHLMGDSSEWLTHSRLSRFKYSKPEYSIKPKPITSKTFSRGDVVVVNDNYKHYCGEMQIVLDTIENDGTRNLVGKITGDELKLLDMIDGQFIAEFIQK